MLSASSNLFTLITLLFLFTRLKHKTKCLCENIFKNFHANSWQPLKKVAFSWHLNYKIAKQHDLVGWTIGKYLNGRYFSTETGKQYSEDSLSLEIIGIDTNEMIKIAEELCKVFDQESVLHQTCRERCYVFSVAYESAKSLEFY